MTPDTRLEASIPGYYQGVEDALFLSRFFTQSREEEVSFDSIQAIIQRCKGKTDVRKKNPPGKKITIRRAKLSDIPGISKLYQEIFITYPFPIQEQYYLKKIMSFGVPFCVAETSDGIIASGSCEIDIIASAVEMSDIAVDKKYRGYGLSHMILSFMEDMMKEYQIKTAFTICRAESMQINSLFSSFDYHYGGTLIKNSNICGKFESMNVWHKRLR